MRKGATMSLTDNTGMYMPVAPAGGYGNGFGGGCGDGWWVVLFLFALMGNNGWGNGGNGGTLPYLYNQSTQNEVSRGFADSAIANQVANLQNSVTNGFNETAMAIANQNFAMQSQLANCCCENRLAIAGLSADIARENCADRQAVADGVQKILDQMCQDKIDSKNEKIAELQNQLNMANIIAAQGANTSRILADNAAQTTALEQYLNPTAIPAYIVQNPNCCQQNTGCGCGGFYN